VEAGIFCRPLDVRTAVCADTTNRAEEPLVRRSGAGGSSAVCPYGQRPWRMNVRTMRQVVSEGGWMPSWVAVVRIVAFVAFDGT
jgi:hypothetical protein